MEQLHKSGIPAKHVWLRFPFFLCTPFLLYARLCKLSWIEEHDGKRYGYWNFKHSWLMKRVFPWVLFVDAALLAGIRVYLPMRLGYSIVCERFVLDMLADFTLAIDNLDFAQSLPGRWFMLLLPKNHSAIILHLDPKTIRERRKDLTWDHRLEARSEVFSHLAHIENIPTITSDLSIQEVNREINSRFGLKYGP